MTANVVFQEELLGSKNLEQRAARAAAGLEREGIREGDVVALMLRNQPAFLEAILACRLLGAYHCPINWHFKADEAGHILRDSGAKLLVVQPDLLAQIQSGIPGELRVLTGWNAWRDSHAPWSGSPRTPRSNMSYTSGTTGVPKGVRRAVPSAAQIAEAREIYRMALGIEPGMRSLVSAPLYHSAPILYAIHALSAGELMVLEPRFDAERTLALIERHRLTHAYLVPTMYVRLLKLPEAVRRRYDLSSMRFVASTGSPCAADVKRAMIDWWGPVITESYASSETGLITFVDSRESLERPGTAGRVLPRGTIRIFDDAGRPLPAGEVGTIYARQPAYPDFTYSNNPGARTALEREGLWSVGDMGYLDRDGYLFVADRKSDMVISGGVNIYPAEIEAVLFGMPGVADCAVFGIPDEEFGEALAAAVEPHPGACISEDLVKAYLKERIAGYKVPRLVAIHDRLPREDSGKIFKRLLREPYWRTAGRRI